MPVLTAVTAVSGVAFIFAAIAMPRGHHPMFYSGTDPADVVLYAGIAFLVAATTFALGPRLLKRRP